MILTSVIKFEKGKLMDSKCKKKLIEDAAFDLFLENGYEATSIRMICKEVGVEPPSIYNFYSSKKGLFLSLADTKVEKYRSYISKRFEELEGQDPEARLFDFFRSSVNYTLINVQDIRFFLRFSLFPPKELHDEIIEFLKSQQSFKLDMNLPLIRECVEQGIITVLPEKAAILFRKFINNNTFDIVFSQWKPDDRELCELWTAFLKCRLNAGRLDGSCEKDK
jgi:AcrR family transcriptional regulator